MNSLNLSFLIIAVVLGQLLVLRFFIWKEKRKRKRSPFTEKILRFPGYKLRQQLDEVGDKLLLTPVYNLMFVMIIIVFSMSSEFKSVPLIIYVATFILFLFYIWQLSRRFKSLVNLHLGWKGEVYTGEELNRLMREGAWVYHDFPYKYGNIDHVVVSRGGVFAIETKAVRKPDRSDGNSEYKVNVQNEVLCFPHMKTSKPIKQAKLHARHLKRFIADRADIQVEVIPVVALPGWYVKDDRNSDVRVINPKRGAVFKEQVKRSNISSKETEEIARSIEEIVRDISPASKRFDPGRRERI